MYHHHLIPQGMRNGTKSQNKTKPNDAQTCLLWALISFLTTFYGSLCQLHEHKLNSFMHYLCLYNHFYSIIFLFSLFAAISNAALARGLKLRLLEWYMYLVNRVNDMWVIHMCVCVCACECFIIYFSTLWWFLRLNFLCFVLYYRCNLFRHYSRNSNYIPTTLCTICTKLFWRTRTVKISTSKRCKANILIHKVFGKLIKQNS